MEVAPGEGCADKGDGVDARRALLVSVGTAGAVALAVGGAWAVSAAVTVADAAGSPVSSSAIVVPAPVESTSARGAQARVPEAPAVTGPQTVPAPAPREVAPSHGSASDAGAQKKPAQKKPVQTKPSPDKKAPAAPNAERTIDQVIAQFEKDGDWDVVVAWVKAQKWDQQKADAWLDFIRDRYDQRKGNAGLNPPSADSAPQTPAFAGTASGADLPSRLAGSQRGQSPDSPSWRD